MKPAVTSLAVLAVLAGVLVAPAPSTADTPDEERPLEALGIPTERSPSPKLPEWSSARRVRPDRRAGAGSTCHADLVREWLRVRCATETFAVSFLGGDTEGVAFWLDPATKDGEVLMPLRPGGKHVVQFWKAGKDRSGAFAPEPLLVVQQYWLEGSAPVLTIQ